MIGKLIRKILPKKTTGDEEEDLSNNIYAVDKGSYRGEFFVYIRQDPYDYYFLSLPDNHSVKMPVAEFRSGIDNKIIELLEKIPDDVYEICLAQFNEAHAKDNINRLKQPPTPSGVDRRQRENEQD